MRTFAEVAGELAMMLAADAKQAAGQSEVTFVRVAWQDTMERLAELMTIMLKTSIVEK